MSQDLTKALCFPEYWNKRYENISSSEEPTHEWLRSFEKIRALLEKHLSSPSTGGPTILHLGCGDSVSPGQ